MRGEVQLATDHHSPTPLGVMWLEGEMIMENMLPQPPVEK